MLKRLKKEPKDIKFPEDLGILAYEYKKLDKRLTGRPVEAASQVIKEMMSDFEIPEEWFTDHSIIVKQPYEKRVEIIKDMLVPMKGEQILYIVDEQFFHEFRYSQEAFQKAVKKEQDEFIRQTIAMLTLSPLIRQISQLRDVGLPRDMPPGWVELLKKGSYEEIDPNEFNEWAKKKYAEIKSAKDGESERG